MGSTPLGKEQAMQTATALRVMPGRPAVTRLVTSTLLRAVETAAIIKAQFSEINIHEDPLLIEGDPTINHHRMDIAFQEYFSPISSDHTTPTEIIICHANIIRFFLCR